MKGIEQTQKLSGLKFVGLSVLVVLIDYIWNYGARVYSAYDMGGILGLFVRLTVVSWILALAYNGLAKRSWSAKGIFFVALVIEVVIHALFGFYIGFAHANSLQH